MEKKTVDFLAFMDLEKAYDRVDREIYGVGGKVSAGLKSFD